MSLGIYISVPFCRTKCSYCNFASDVFSRAVFGRYVDRVCLDISNSVRVADQMGGRVEGHVDSIYLGGGTPTVLELAQVRRIFSSVSEQFQIANDVEITIECAPGTLTAQLIETLLACGVNRVSLGVQSFIDREAAAVGRQHKRVNVLDDIARLRASGIANLNVDLIAGLPHQTQESWNESVVEAIATGVPHVSVYMLEVDDDSRLGRELIAGGTRYHAHFVPDEGAVADFYEMACEKLEASGITQYEISNFARAGGESRHNLKYWTRQPYLGFGVDAHSMLYSDESSTPVLRFSTADSLERYVTGSDMQKTVVSDSSSCEETFFLGLRLNRGVDLREVGAAFGESTFQSFHPIVQELVSEGLLDSYGDIVRLTPRGRLFSNEVFERFIALPDRQREAKA